MKHIRTKNKEKIKYLNTVHNQPQAKKNFYNQLKNSKRS